MIKKQFLLLFLLTSFVSFGQYHIKGRIKPFTTDVKWAMLYQIKDGRQHYIKDSKIDNKSFYFEIPQNAPSGMYRIVYRLKGEGYLDFLFNKEDVSFSFNPDFPDESVVFSISKENKMYQAYLQNVFTRQQYLDSIQITYFKNQTLVAATLYQEAYYELKHVQKEYQQGSYGMLTFNFIEATQRYNSKTAVLEPKVYLENIKNNFFEHINFKDDVLVNSSFLVDRTIDYVFNLNYSKDPETQEGLYKESIKNVIEIPKKIELQKDLIEIIIKEFAVLEDLEMVNYLLNNYYKNLPTEQQSKTYIEETLASVSIAVGRLAPDFKWGKEKRLSLLNTHKYYILVFWSTGCSHCKAQLPEMYSFLKDKKNIQVVAVALEKDSENWEKLTPSFKGWEHVLGKGKWKNNIARSYGVESTPTYLLLNANKIIIALPDDYKELKEAVGLLK